MEYSVLFMEFHATADNFTFRQPLQYQVPIFFTGQAHKTNGIITKPHRQWQNPQKFPIQRS
jgi:hypothetical protein